MAILQFKRGDEMACLTRIENYLYYYKDGIIINGNNPGLTGNCSELRGNCTGLTGDLGRIMHRESKYWK